MPNLYFNPVRDFSIYLDGIASLHANSDHSSDLLFPSCQGTKTLEASWDKPVSYSVLQKQFLQQWLIVRFRLGCLKSNWYSIMMSNMIKDPLPSSGFVRTFVVLSFFCVFWVINMLCYQYFITLGSVFEDNFCIFLELVSSLHLFLANRFYSLHFDFSHKFEKFV